MEDHTGGSRFSPTVHPCLVRQGGCGWPMQLHEPERSTHKCGTQRRRARNASMRTEPNDEREGAQLPLGSTFNLYSFVSNGLVPGGQNLSRRQTVFFLPVDPRKEDHKDPEYIDYSVPRLARYLHSTWKRHQDAVFWVDIDLGIKEGLVFYQTRSNAIILQGTLPANCIVRAERLKTGEKLYERQYLSPRPPPKISLKHDPNWNEGNDQSGSAVEQQPVGKLVQQSLGETHRAESSKPTQSKPNPTVDRTVKPVTQEIVGKSQGELSSSDRTGETCER